MTDTANHSIKRFPEWLRRSLPSDSAEKTHGILSRFGLNTVCESANCPNRSECYSAGTATFMLLGNTCTRRCGFCDVPTGKGEVLNIHEPNNVAEAVKEMGLRYVVLTSVARDDLADEGAGHFAETIRRVLSLNPEVQVEVLTPDFHARPELIEKVINAGPEVYNHNIETVRRFQKAIRPQSSYERSLDVLRVVKGIKSELTTKSGIMLGLGETDEELDRTADDLLNAGCDILTIGQYLEPSREHYSVFEYVRPEKFKEIGERLKAKGFREVFSGPYVRSSYHAGETYSKANLITTL